MSITAATVTSMIVIVSIGVIIRHLGPSFKFHVDGVRLEFSRSGCIHGDHELLTPQKGDTRSLDYDPRDPELLTLSHTSASP